MICFGVKGNRRIGRHRPLPLGRPTYWQGHNLVIAKCYWCGRSQIVDSPPVGPGLSKARD